MKFFLCIEGGGTHTRGGLYDSSGILLRECVTAPANPSAYGDARCLEIICQIANTLVATESDGLECAIGLAGAGNPVWRNAFLLRLAEALSVNRARVCSDLDPLLHANAPTGPAIIAISGTGSSVLAKKTSGEVIRIGGRGTVYGDDGSAYGVAVRAMRAAAHAFDGFGKDTLIVRHLMSLLSLDDFNDLVPWSLQASKQSIAKLAELVGQLAEEGDAVAAACINEEARLFAMQIIAALERLEAQEETLPLFLNGGLIQNSPYFRSALIKWLAAYPLLQWHCPPPIHGHSALLHLAQAETNPSWSAEWVKGIRQNTTLPETESASALNIDELSPLDLVRCMCEADLSLQPAVLNQAVELAECITLATAAISSGGRVIYIGAGTSGRLGVLDASECPPTFGVSSKLVVGVIAGGIRALTESVEGAEDDCAAAEKDLHALNINEKDFVVGIAASGSTPYTRQALAFAKTKGAKTALLCCNPKTESKADVIVRLNTGAEMLPGSTRLKAGSATKMALNIISTGAMAQAGYMYRGRMVFMRPINEKLKARAIRILTELCGVSADDAGKILLECDWEIPTALISQSQKINPEKARTLLKESGATLKSILGGT